VNIALCGVKKAQSNQGVTLIESYDIRLRVYILTSVKVSHIDHLRNPERCVGVNEVCAAGDAVSRCIT
jgi:hypothetical protein